MFEVILDKPISAEPCINETRQAGSFRVYAHRIGKSSCLSSVNGPWLS